MFASRVCVLDTETSGLPRDPHAVPIDVGAVILDTDGAEVASFSTLVRPAVWGDAANDAARIHGITLAMVSDAPNPAEVVEDLAEWLRVNGCRWVTSYSVEFDREMLARMGFEYPRWAPCVMRRALAIMGPAGALRPADPTHPRYDSGSPWLFPPLSPRPESDRRGLSACEFFGVEPEMPAHRALSDATTAARVLKKIVGWR